MSAKILGPGAKRQADRDQAKAEWVVAAYTNVPFLSGARKPPAIKLMSASVRTSGGRNRCGAAVGKRRPKWMLAPVAAQMHPERHVHPRAKRSGRP